MDGNYNQPVGQAMTNIHSLRGYVPHPTIKPPHKEPSVIIVRNKTENVSSQPGSGIG